MLKNILLIAVLSLGLTTVATAAATSDLIELVLTEVGTGSTEEMRKRIFNTPITVLGPEFRRRAIQALPASMRDDRITEGKLLRRVERVIKPVLQLHSRNDNVELFLYHGDIHTPKGILWMGCVLVISDSLAAPLYDEELMGIVAHEMAHSYFMDEMCAAQRAKDHLVMRVIELKCDAVAILSLKLLGVDPTHHARGVRRVMNLSRSGDFLDIKYQVGSKSELKTHPSIVERAQFSQRFIRLLVR